MSIHREARLSCDSCGLVWATGTDSSRELRADAKRMGWLTQFDRRYDYCPDCKPKPFKLEDE